MPGLGLSKLTQREWQVFWLIVNGGRNPILAQELGISIRTVETHRFNMRKKLGIDGVADAVRLAQGIQS
jgi:two-component system, NarL family, nitrate/nitrite response regulator NarL